MNAKNQWRVFALAVLLAATVNLHNAEAHAGQYELTVTTDGDADGPTYEDTETVKRIGVAGWNAYTSGYALCSADAWTEVVGDSASLDKEAWAGVRYEWEWDGPSGTEPRGGSLYWENDGDGSATVDGGTRGSGGSATAEGSAFSLIRVAPPVSSTSTISGEALGEVTHGTIGTGSTSTEGNPVQEHSTSDPKYNYYYYSISWNGLYTDTDTIPAGTSIFVLVGGVICQCESETHSSETVISESDTTSEANVWAYADFTSN